MSIETKKISDFKVKKIDLPKHDTSKIKGYDLIHELYANIFILARKKQGKTVLLANILKECATTDTHIIFFVSTIMKDSTYIEILSRLREKGIGFTCFMSIQENGRDNLKDIIDKLKNTPPEDPKAEEEEKEKNKPIILNFDEDLENEIKLKIRKPSKIGPKYIFVFDDLSAEIKNNPNVRQLLKQNRHYLSKVIISSQYVTDLSPDSRAQIDVWLLLGSQNEDKLKLIYESCDPVIEFDDFQKLFEDATKDMYHFFYIDKNEGVYRKDFNYQYVIKDSAKFKQV